MSPLIIQKNYINGEWTAPRDNATITVYNPANNDILGIIPDLGAEETESAILAAHRAQDDWAALTAYERGGMLRKWYELMVRHREELALVMTLENGKPLAESRGELDYASSFIDWFAEEAKRSYGRQIPSAQKNRTLQTIKQPVGVCGIITPWNFPAAMITRKIAAAFAAGCTVVVKPDHRTPYSAIALVKLAEEAGIPKGVFNLITGDAATIGGVLTQHDLVKKISFTGSTPVGRLLMAQGASTLKRMSLELGGNAPFIVCEDADLTVALDALMAGKIRNAGQACVAPNRIFVHEKIYDEFVEALTLRVRALKMGDGREDGVQLGPLIDQKAVEKMEHLVTDAVNKGAHLVLGGESPGQGSNFYPVTILSDVSQEAECEQGEIFGPVFALSSFSDDAECLARSNASEVGLAAYVMTQSLRRMDFYTRGIECGMVGVNSGVISFAAAPFGGYKQSGLHREGGEEGLDAYLQTKYIAVQN
ncbi:MAG: Aldehyde dehydrogenase [Alphaproteobacteria bacterium]|nr:Aldehyde dehydrogenase [Alphaproteobacteria bacterium]